MKNRIFNILIIGILLLNGLGAAQAQRKPASNLMTVNIYVAKELENEADYDKVEGVPDKQTPFSQRRPEHPEEDPQTLGLTFPLHRGSASLFSY